MSHCIVAGPRFESVENQPRDVNVSVGDDVIIRCVTYANPPATVQWMQNGKPLSRKYQSTVTCALHVDLTDSARRQPK